MILLLRLTLIIIFRNTISTYLFLRRKSTSVASDFKFFLLEAFLYFQYIHTIGWDTIICT